MQKKTPELSVIMSLYIKEKANYFYQCLESIKNQTIIVSEIILVLDGPINNELEDVINYWEKLLPIKKIKLEKNEGLAKALNKGLKHCSYDYIARMDTDDICTPERFEKQIDFLNSNPHIDIVGTWISEIDEYNNIINSCVKYPLEHQELFYFFKRRNPLAHPTVMFKRSFFEKAGDYNPNFLQDQDTVLWYQGFKNGCIFSNIPFIGLHFRRTSDFYQRRSGKKKTLSLLMFRLRKINKDLNYDFTANFYAILYSLLSLAPRFVKKIIYKYFR
ncbi:glycosyltransferase [Xenorhabdus budapestensis]|uniref:glycosyltransferase n=1 Tax=Xenorhabdus budapestensis TaxID=290110 RepID=UPI003A8973CE